MSPVQAQTLAVDHPSWADVFPLPLTPMETFFFIDARPGYAMMNDVELEFRGPLEREIFFPALEAALARNPFFRSLIEHDPRLGPVWQPTDQTPVVVWESLDAPLDERYDAPLDLTKEIGLRIWVRQDSERAKMLLHFHHSCADALGTFAFVEDFLAAYATLCGQAVASRPLEPLRLKRRGLASIPYRNWYQRIFDIFVGMRESSRLVLQAPTPLAGTTATDRLPSADGSPAKSTEGADRAVMLSRSLGTELTTRLRHAATAAGVTLNDLLICDLFATLRKWNAEHGLAGDRNRLRILMPQNLRETEDAATPTANIMSFAFLNRRARQCDDRRSLAKSVHDETELIRRHRLSAYFLGTLATSRALGILDKVLASQLCFSTAVLTNFGVPSRRFVARFPQADGGLLVGNTVFRGLTGVPPTRPGTRAAFSLSTNGGDLTVSLKRDPQHLGPIDGARLLDEYVNQMTATAARALAEGNGR